jgi:hypothetical protein
MLAWSSCAGSARRAFDAFKALAEKPMLTVTEQLDCAEAEEAVRELDEAIIGLKAAQTQIARALVRISL